MPKPLLAILLLLPLSTATFAGAEAYRCKVIEKVGVRYDGETDTITQLSYRIDDFDEYRVLSHEALVEKVGAEKLQDWRTSEWYEFELGHYYVRPAYADPSEPLSWRYLRRFVDDSFHSDGATIGDTFYFNVSHLRLEAHEAGGVWAHKGTDKKQDTVSSFSECHPYYD